MATVARRNLRGTSRLLNPSCTSPSPVACQTPPLGLRSELAFGGTSAAASTPSVSNTTSFETSRSSIWGFRVLSVSKNLVDMGRELVPQDITGIWSNGSCLDRSVRGLHVTFGSRLSTVGAKKFAAMASTEERILGIGEDEGIVELEGSSNIIKDQDQSADESIVEDNDSLFTPAQSLVDVTGQDVLKYITISEEDQLKYFGEGLPRGMKKEFEVTSVSAVMIRPRLLHLCNQLQRSVTDTMAFDLSAEDMIATRPRRHFLVDGPVGSGKSVALAMLVHWARTKGWLVFYIPSGKDWTHGSLYYKNEDSGLVDTPITAQIALEGFLKSHSELLATLPCRISDPIPLGEGAGVPRARGAREFTLPEGATVKQLVEKGLSMSHAGVGTVIRLRKELSLIKEVPVLIAIDDYNSWFIFSEYGVRAKKPIHAQKLAMVNAFRPMEGSSEMMVAAFSHSNAVGKLPVQLPGIPKGVRFDFPRYSPLEANTALQYYHSRKVTSQEPAEDDVIRLYYLTNGNGNELRTLARFM